MEAFPDPLIDADLECGASQLVRYVDSQMNAGAKREAAEATAVTQESGADLYEGNAYLDQGGMTFESRSVACGVCKSKALLLESGSVVASRCLVSGSCEVDWINKYPQKYRDSRGNLAVRQLICAPAEIDCGACVTLFDVNGDIMPTVTRGTCYVTDRGRIWRAMRDHIKEADCIRPELGIQQFDGEEFDETETSEKLLQTIAARLRGLLERKRALLS